MKKSFVYLAGVLAAGMLSPLAAQAASETIGHASVMQQQVVVKGHVTDAYGEAVVGATVLEKGTRNATITDNKGDFTLKVKAGATVTISYVGYRAQDLAAASTMNVVLRRTPKASAKSLSSDTVPRPASRTFRPASASSTMPKN